MVIFQTWFAALLVSIVLCTAVITALVHETKRKNNLIIDSTAEGLRISIARGDFSQLRDAAEVLVALTEADAVLHSTTSNVQRIIEEVSSAKKPLSPAGISRVLEASIEALTRAQKRIAASSAP